MSKHITNTNLKTLLPPLKHLIDKKAEGIDWNENDPSASGYIKNRPFYTEIKEESVEILPNTVIEYSDYQENYVTINQALIEGQAYIVTWNGVEYTCIGRNYDGYIMLGNNAHYEWDNGITTDTGEPFALEANSDLNNLSLGIYVDRTNEEYEGSQISISIRSCQKKTNIVKIPSEYLPEINIPEGASIGIKGTGENAEVFNGGNADQATGDYAHVEGMAATASGHASHAEGSGTFAYAINSHAEGYYTQATGSHAHAEGHYTKAFGAYSHTEGYYTEASNQASHAEGYRAKAYGPGSHAEGYESTVKSPASYSHAEGMGTIAETQAQHVQGRYNIEDTNTTSTYGQYAHIVGNGWSTTQRSNAHTLDWSGNAWFQGEVKIGGTGQDDATAKTLATTEYVDSKFDSINTPQSQVILVDQETGENYILCIKNGNLVTHKAE